MKKVREKDLYTFNLWKVFNELVWYMRITHYLWLCWINQLFLKKCQYKALVSSNLWHALTPVIPVAESWLNSTDDTPELSRVKIGAICCGVEVTKSHPFTSSRNLGSSLVVISAMLCLSVLSAWNEGSSQHYRRTQLVNGRICRLVIASYCYPPISSSLL